MPPTLTMGLEMMSWVYNIQLKWLLPPEHRLLGIPGPVFCQTILMCMA